MLPPAFTRAKLHGVLPVCRATGLMGMSFQLEDGTMVRIALPEDQVASLMAGVSFYLAKCGVQSEMSSGKPRCDVSPLEGQ